ncbi:MAG: hypothetical protein ACRELV_17080 [Longimicrobiales bacterium]
MRGFDTRWLMAGSAILLAVPGLICTFLPIEMLRWIGAPPSAALVLPLQALGALYLGFAMLNWMGRGGLMGGIYGRPVAMGNLAHFLIVAIALCKALASGPAPALYWPLAIVYAFFATAFGLILFRHPVRP